MTFWFRKYSNLIIVLSLVFIATFLSLRYSEEESVSQKQQGENAFSEDSESSEEDLDIDIDPAGENLTAEQEYAVEEQLEENAENITITDEPEDGGSVDSPVEEESKGDTGMSAPAVAERPLPSAQKGDAGELRIGFVTDTHITSTGASGRRVIGQKYQDRLNFFVKKMNNIFGADILIANGDIIEGTRQTADTGMQELMAVKKIFASTLIPTYWVIGNHDLRAVTKKQWKTALGIDYTYTAFDVKQYRIFILDSNFNSANEHVGPGPGRSYTRGKVSPEQLVWLERELQKTKKKPLVFMHHPPLRGIEAKIDEGLLKNANDIRKIFAENKVFAVFSGHIEDLYFEKTDGVRYFVLPGLVKHPDYQGTFATISASGDNIEVDVSYLKKDGTYRTIQMKQK